jgi:tetratricopeptide (TPR) repeat protein
MVSLYGVGSVSVTVPASSRRAGNLPLALSHAAGYCSFGVSFEEYLALLNDLPIANTYASDHEGFYRETVASTWASSITAAQTEADLSKPILEMAAYLAPDGIPRWLFEHLAAAGSDRDHPRLLKAFVALHRFSLVELGSEDVRVHRLLQRVVRDSSPNGAAGAISALEAVAEAFPSNTQDPREWHRCETLLPHVLALSETAPWSSHVGTLVSIMQDAESYLLAAGDTGRAMTIGERLLGLVEQHLGSGHVETLGLRHLLAYAYRSAGRHDEATAVAERLVRDCEDLLGRDDSRTLSARINLASSYWTAGRLDDAIQQAEGDLEDCKRLLGCDDPSTLTARGNLASCYSLAGRHKDAADIEELHVRECERTLGVDHPAHTHCPPQSCDLIPSCGSFR